MDAVESLQGELTAAWLYRVIAEREREPRKRRLFEQLAHEAQAQAAICMRVFHAETLV